MHTKLTNLQSEGKSKLIIFQASRPHYQNTDERINELSSNVTPQNDQLIMNPLQRMSHPHIDEAARSVGRSSSETQGPAQSLSGRLNNAVESMKYYSIDGGMRNVSVESVDLTTDCENSISVSHSDLKKIRLVRNERENDIPSEINHRNKIMNDEATVVVVPGNSVHEDFDFSIPYKESNILIKVMTGAHQPSTPQQETLQCDTEPKPEVHSLKRVSFDEEPKASKFIELYVSYVFALFKCLVCILHYAVDVLLELFS